MASPQLENGYIKIASDIYDAFSSIRIPGECRQVIDFIIRKTYGFHKKEDFISISQFVIGTKMKKPTVCRALNKAIKMNIIIKKDNALATNYRFNKDFDTWKPLSKKITTSSTIIQKDNKSLSKKIHTIDTNTKDINTAEASAFSFEEEMKKLKESERRDFKTIELYWRKKGWSFKNKEQFNAALRRELRPARNLIGYTGKEIALAIQHCIANYSEVGWTLETCHKRITDLINKKQ